MTSVLQYIFRVLLHKPMSLMGWRLERIGREPVVSIRACCHLCEHYVPPGDLTPCLDGDPGAYCKHPDYWNGHYMIPELAQQIGLHRRPGDWCVLFSLCMQLGVASGYMKITNKLSRVQTFI